MSWSTRETVLVVAVLVAVASAGFVVSSSLVSIVAVAAAVAFVAGLALARLRFLEARLEHAAAETQASMELARILPLRAPMRPMTGWAITPELGAILVRTVLEKRPKVIVELGSGVSSVIHGYALELVGGGRLISLDHDREYANVTRREIALHGLERFVEVVDAPLVTHRIGDESFEWYSLDALPDDLRIDLLLVDGPPASMHAIARYPALPLLLSRLSDDATILLDDAARGPEKTIVARWLAAHRGHVEHVFHRTRKGVSTVLVRSRDVRVAGSHLA